MLFAAEGWRWHDFSSVLFSSFALDNLISKSKTSNCWKQIMAKMLIPSKFLTVRPKLCSAENLRGQRFCFILAHMRLEQHFQNLSDVFDLRHILNLKEILVLPWILLPHQNSLSLVSFPMDPNGGLVQGTVAVPCTTPVSMEPLRPLVSCWQQVAILGWKMTMGFLGEFPQFGSKKMRCDWSLAVWKMLSRP